MQSFEFPLFCHSILIALTLIAFTKNQYHCNRNFRLPTEPDVYPNAVIQSTSYSWSALIEILTVHLFEFRCQAAYNFIALHELANKIMNFMTVPLFCWAEQLKCSAKLVHNVIIAQISICILTCKYVRSF